MSAIVTGGAGGLGAATGRYLAEVGLKVVVADLRLELAESVAATIQANHVSATAIALDVSNPSQIQAAVEQVLERYGQIDVLVNNAGIDVTLSIEELALSQWQQVIDVNLNEPFYMAKAVFPHLRA
ncbi:MAG: SDR family oxidoreductase [Leptolyngbyaceae cyanobacterium SM1_1_3]|nr:SDR family oxidoreductase [Leptolyngbyaceae cyanobacterium SM1_1_3]